MENQLLNKALEYVDRGWYIFPVREIPSAPFKYQTKSGEVKEKILKVKSPYTKEGFMDATQDKEKIKMWWEKKPNAGIGISCGHSNLVVIDIDIRDGKKGFDNYMSMNVSDEGALHAKTPSGGTHIIFTGKMNSHADVKNGVDIRSTGAYIVAPPSWILEDGVRKFYTELDNWDKVPAQVPSSLEKEIEKLRGKTSTDRKTRTIVSSEPIEITVNRLRKALTLLPPHMCEDYFQWVNVGMALKTIGEEGFSLWDEWSQKSSKYDREALEYRWERFKPSNITIASIFHHAKQANNDKS